MTQVTTTHYKVKQVENVTIRVSAVKTGLECSASLDQKDLPAASDIPRLYKFPISANEGKEQDFGFEGELPPDPGAHYELFVTGDDGTEFQGPWYEQTDLGDPITIVFEVTE